jgi:heme exporter protein D
MTQYPQREDSRDGGILGEIRRQMEEMLGGTRPVRPSALPGTPTTRRGGAVGEDAHFGLAMAAVASYWALPLMARRKQKRRMQRRREREQQASSNGTGAQTNTGSGDPSH